MLLLFLSCATADCTDGQGTLDIQIISNPEPDSYQGMVLYLQQLAPEVWDPPLQIPAEVSGLATIEVDPGSYEYWASGTADGNSYESETKELSLDPCETLSNDLRVYGLLGTE
jgi:hypothetical protein